MKPCVFIHTNHKQQIGALVSAYSMRRNSRMPDAFDVKLIELKDHMDIFGQYEGREYSRDGDSRRLAERRPAVLHAACASCRPS